mmetsp:Transcript_1036/g.3382  ORF Transcript_1036/g.3382 Transcript_1036/m.3382 type:complete len:242 (+) Transcript_1036:1001-1726(+)
MHLIKLPHSSQSSLIHPRLHQPAPVPSARRHSAPVSFHHPWRVPPRPRNQARRTGTGAGARSRRRDGVVIFRKPSWRRRASLHSPPPSARLPNHPPQREAAHPAPPRSRRARRRGRLGTETPPRGWRGLRNALWRGASRNRLHRRLRAHLLQRKTKTASPAPRGTPRARRVCPRFGTAHLQSPWFPVLSSARHNVPPPSSLSAKSVSRNRPARASPLPSNRTPRPPRRPSVQSTSRVAPTA